MSTIYHITTREAWLEALERGAYRAASLASEGFIHCSTRDQVLGVANAFYRDVPDLVLLCIDAAWVGAEVRYEAPAEEGHTSPSGRFPHIYGLLPVEAVVQVADFPHEPDGTFDFPPEIAALD